MASIHGTSCAVSLDNSSGTPVDIAQYVDDLQPEMSQAIHAITTFGMNAIAKTVGLKDGKCQIAFISNSTVLAHLRGLFNGQTPGTSTTWTITIGPRGTTSGFDRFSAELIMTQLPIPVKVDDVEKISVQFEVTGGWTLDTY